MGHVAVGIAALKAYCASQTPSHTHIHTPACIHTDRRLEREHARERACATIPHFVGMLKTSSPRPLSVCGCASLCVCVCLWVCLCVCVSVRIFRQVAWFMRQAINACFKSSRCLQHSNNNSPRLAGPIAQHA